jgi:hypothetical protein
MVTLRTSIISIALAMATMGCATASGPVYTSQDVEIQLGAAQISEESVALTKAESIAFLRQPGQTDAQVESELIAISLLMGCDFDRDISVVYQYVANCESRLTTNMAEKYIASYNSLIQPKIKETKKHRSLPHKTFIDYVKLHNDLYYYAADVLTADFARRSEREQAWTIFADTLDPSSRRYLTEFVAAEPWDQFAFAGERVFEYLNSRSRSGTTKQEALVLGIAMTNNLTTAHDLLYYSNSFHDRALKYADWLLRKFRRYQISARVEVWVTRSDGPLGLLVFELVVGDAKGTASTLIPLGIHRVDAMPPSETDLKYIYYLESGAQTEVTPRNIAGLLGSHKLKLRYYQVGTLNEGQQTTPKYVTD